MGGPTDFAADCSITAPLIADLSERDRSIGMRLVLVDGLTSQAMETLASGGAGAAIAIFEGKIGNVPTCTPSAPNTSARSSRRVIAH